MKRNRDTLGPITPAMMTQAVQFQAVSGNKVTSLKLIGVKDPNSGAVIEGGFRVTWENDPTDQDIKEFGRWFEQQHPDYLVRNFPVETADQEDAQYRKWLDSPAPPDVK